MAKTIRGKVSLDHLRGLLTEHCRKLPSYQRVESDTIEVRFFGDYIYLELRQPSTEKCYHCEGTGKEYDYDYAGGEGKVSKDEPCPVCDGTGQRGGYDTTTARLVKKEHPKTGAKVAIEVFTEGKKLEVWKPAVEKIKTFLEELVGEPCIVVPMSKKEQIASQPPLEEQLQRTIEAGEHNARRYEAVKGLKTR